MENGKPEPSHPPQTPDELAVEAAVRHHTTSYKQVCKERDDLQKLSDRQEQMLTVSKIETEGLRAELATERSRTTSYQAERDDAVANLTVYQTLFITTMANFRAFGIEHAPLIKESNEKPTA